MRTAASISLVLIAAVTLACSRSQPAASPVEAPAVDSAPEPSAALVVDVRTTRVSRGAIQPHVSASGSILARRVSRIGAEVRGRIEEVFVDEGDRVAAGDPLFQIDRESFEVALRQAEAGLDLARSERRHIQVDLRRVDELHKRDIV